MKISYTQLQTYLEDKLPTPEKLADAFTFHAFEIESLEKVGDDIILDIKVLPDRACYAKSYEGIAREVSTILGLKKKDGMVKIPVSMRTIIISVSQINEVLGSEITPKEAVSILTRMDINVTEKGDTLELAVPGDRLDLQVWRDIPEEVGRIYGYDKIKSILPKNTTSKPVVEKSFYYAEKIKNILVDVGFSEVYLYSLVAKGVYEIEKPLASDKNHLRTNLTDGIVKSLEFNAKNADLLGLDEIKIFEIGKVFTKNGEHTSLCVGIKNIKKKPPEGSTKESWQEKEKIKKIRGEVVKVLEVNSTILCTVDDSGGIISLNEEAVGMTNNSDGIFEINLDKVVATLPEPTSYADLNFDKAVSIEYKKFSMYPFIARDIAVFVPETIDDAAKVWLAVEKGIANAEATNLLAHHSLFDTFKKDGKVSYAYRMIFQSMDKTLTDDEVNAIMEKIYAEIKDKGWEVR